MNEDSVLLFELLLSSGFIWILRVALTRIFKRKQEKLEKEFNMHFSLFSKRENDFKKIQQHLREDWFEYCETKFGRKIKSLKTSELDDLWKEYYDQYIKTLKVDNA